MWGGEGLLRVAVRVDVLLAGGWGLGGAGKGPHVSVCEAASVASNSH